LIRRWVVAIGASTIVVVVAVVILPWLDFVSSRVA
jgi:hypothetical protein